MLRSPKLIGKDREKEDPPALPLYLERKVPEVKPLYTAGGLVIQESKKDQSKMRVRLLKGN